MITIVLNTSMAFSKSGLPLQRAAISARATAREVQAGHPRHGASAHGRQMGLRSICMSCTANCAMRLHRHVAHGPRTICACLTVAPTTTRETQAPGNKCQAACSRESRCERKRRWACAFSASKVRRCYRMRRARRRSGGRSAGLPSDVDIESAWTSCRASSGEGSRRPIHPKRSCRG